MRKRIVKWSIFLLLVVGGMQLYGQFSQKKNSQEMLDFPIIVKASVLQTKKPEKNLNPSVEMIELKEPENREEEEERDYEEAELVEMIANPLLLEWTRLEDFTPFVSYVSAMNLEEQGYDYVPRAGLEDPEEIRTWGEEILYDLVLHPQKVEEYGAILTLTSVEAWEAFQWIYANPEDYYCSVYTLVWKSNNSEYVNFTTDVEIPAEYFFGDLHRLNALDRTYAEGVSQELFDFIQASRDIGIEISWSYERETGLIQIKKMEYGKLGGGAEFNVRD